MAGKGPREAYKWELVAERLAGVLRDTGGKAKDWGHEAEDLARIEYQARTGNLVRQVGFAVHDRIQWVGASSDGLVDEDGSIEIKSPFNSAIQARTLALGMPDDHRWQTQGNIWVLERRWIDFLSYDPAFKKPMNLFIERHERDDYAIKHLEPEVKTFLAEVAIEVRKIKANHK